MYRSYINWGDSFTIHDLSFIVANGSFTIHNGGSKNEGGSSINIVACFIKMKKSFNFGDWNSF